MPAGRGAVTGAPVRRGKNSHTSAATTSPGTVNQRKSACHPCAAMIVTAIGAAIAGPNASALCRIPLAVERSRESNVSPNARKCAPLSRPSPRPKQKRTAISTATVVANAVSPVNSDQSTSATTSMRRTPKRSASIPPGICISA